MSTWTIKSIMVRVRRLFNKREPDPKEPRKKIQLQLKQIFVQFNNQKNELEKLLELPDLTSSTLKIGKILLQDANRIEELQLTKINDSRLDSFHSSLIPANDFSLWIRHEIANLVEEIFHFTSTLNKR